MKNTTWGIPHFKIPILFFRKLFIKCRQLIFVINASIFNIFWIKNSKTVQATEQDDGNFICNEVLLIYKELSLVSWTFCWNTWWTWTVCIYWCKYNNSAVNTHSNTNTNTNMGNGVTFRRLPNGGMAWSFSTSGEVIIDNRS